MVSLQYHFMLTGTGCHLLSGRFQWSNVIISVMFVPSLNERLGSWGQRRAHSLVASALPPKLFKQMNQNNYLVGAPKRHNHSQIRTQKVVLVIKDEHVFWCFVPQRRSEPAGLVIVFCSKMFTFDFCQRTFVFLYLFCPILFKNDS